MDSRFFNDLIDDIQNSLSNRRLLFNQNNNSSRRSSNNNRNDRSRHNNNNNNNTSQMLYTLQLLNNSMSEYNENMRAFLEIIRLTLSTMQDEYADYEDEQPNIPNTTNLNHNRSTQNTPVINNQRIGALPRLNESMAFNNQTMRTTPITITSTTTTTTRNTPRTRYIAQTPSNPLFNAINAIFTQPFQDVVVAPTSEQISSATRIFPFTNNSDILNTQCPITLEQFENGQQICQIIHCGHCFAEASIRNWFQRNVHCPVCRYDIRDDLYTNTDANIDISNNNLYGNFTLLDGPVSSILDRLSDQFTDIINRGNPELYDPSMNVIYRFEMPYQYLETYEYYDASGNDVAT